VRLSIYLQRQEFSEFDDFIKEKYKNGQVPVDEPEPDKALPYESKTILLRTQKDAPRWAKYLESHFDLHDLEITNYSFVHLLKASNRIFAVTFGYGYVMLEDSCMEPNFGLRVCANSLDPKQLKTLDVRSIDIVTKQQRTNLSTGADILDFGVELDEEWIRYLSGIPLDQAFAYNIAGSNSLRIKTDIKIEELAQKCEEILSVYQSDNYKENFAYLDHYRALDKNDPIISDLESKLEEKIKDQSHEKISVASPELLDEQNIDRYRIFQSHRNHEFPELILDEIYQFVSNHPEIENPLKKIKIIPVDQDDNPCSKSSILLDYMVFEINYNDNLYVLSAGTWFRVDLDYAESVRNRVQQINDLTSDLNLPSLNSGEAEGDYNIRLADERNWVKFDKNLISLSEPYQKVEVCDVYTDDNYLLCIKKMNRSSTLSHLFAQAFVAADLLKGDTTYRAKVKEILQDAGKSANIDDPIPTFVLTFITSKTEPIWKSIFLFSAIHLVKDYQFIKRLGYNVAVAKVDVE
jgi:uncharacterized protein (TIGR04141 family)